MSATLSKYIRAATQTSEVAAQAVAARDDARDIPHPFETREIHSDGYQAAAGTHAELCAALTEVHESERIKVRAGIEGTVLWAAQGREGPATATDAALCRLDAYDEQHARYRAATYLPARTQRREAGITVTKSLPRSLHRKIELLAQLRGEEFTQTLEHVIAAGVILMDERAKRYEAAALIQLMEVAAAGRELEAARYINLESPSLERAYEMVADPMRGAPESIALLVSQFPRAS